MEPSPPADPVSAAQRLFVAAAEAAAPELTAIAARRGRSHLNEREDLEPAFRRALEALAFDSEPRPLVSHRLSHGLPTAVWPKLGRFDVSLQWPEAMVFGELKCGVDEAALSACAWDALKCAFCLRHDIGAGMLIVAAAPLAMWRRAKLGTELFADRQWDAQEIRSRYAAGFLAWERDGNKPLQVPRRFATHDVGRVELVIADAPWLIGIARVEPASWAWLDWEPFLR